MLRHRRRTSIRSAVAGTPIQELEARTLLSGNVRVITVGNTVQLIGDKSANHVEVTSSESGIIITGIDDTTINGEDELEIEIPVANLRVSLGKGDDSLSLSGLELAGSLTVAMGAGENSVFIDASTFGSSVSIAGGSKRDVVGVIDTSVGGQLLISAGGASDVVGLGSVEVGGALNVRLGTGNDWLAITNVSTSGKTNIASQGGADVTAISGGDFSGNFNYAGGSGAESLLVGESLFGGDAKASLGSGRDLLMLDEGNEYLGAVRFRGGSSIDTFGDASESFEGAPEFTQFENLDGFDPDAVAALLDELVAELEPYGLEGLIGGESESPPDENEQESSSGSVAVSGVDPLAFNALSSSAIFTITGAQFATGDNASVILLRNGEQVSNDLLTVTSATVTATGALVSGKNDLQFSALDNQGFVVTTSIVVWAGSSELKIKVVDENGDPVTEEVTVQLRLGDDPNVTSNGVTVDGVATFQDIPARTVLASAVASGNRFGVAGGVGNEGQLILVLQGFQEPSQVDNNDFSQGTEGWNIGNAPVQIVPHVEELPSAITLASSSPSASRITSPAVAAAATTAAESDQDLVLTTSGEGPQSISRTFQVKPGTKTVKLRFRFVTSEVPGGYFGSQFNDYFKVSIRSLQGGGNAVEANNMNAMGLAAFDANGATAWREVTLPVSVEGDTIQVDITVANVADGALDSKVIVDRIDEGDLAISSLKLNDIDNASLQYLSVGDHTYFGGNTRVHGTIAIEGKSDDKLSSLVLEVVQNGSVVATAQLSAAAQAKLLSKNFGDSGKLEITASELLFELSSAESTKVDASANGTVVLRVKADSTSGQTATKEFGVVQILTRYTASNRYGGRDGADHGGDDWVLPSVKTVIEHFSGITVGDISNMNGGKFSPHAGHQNGAEFDGHFAGYNDRDADTAATMIAYLNDDTYGSRITLVYVTYTKTANNAFWNAIKDVTLDDGRKAADVIRPASGHGTHFHWNISV